MKPRQCKICLVGPDKNTVGGVSSYTKTLRLYSKSKHYFIPLHSVTKSDWLPKLFSLFFSYLQYLSSIIFFKIDIVHLNTSLERNALIRDSVFAVISKIFRKKLFIQWHGWDPAKLELIYKNKNWFLHTLGLADQINILVPAIQPCLQSIGFKNKIQLSNTFLSDKDIPKKVVAHSGEIKNLLFLSTISFDKGIYETMKIFEGLSLFHPELRFIIAGDGPELESIKESASAELKSKILFTGYVYGREKGEIFSNSDLYLFPSHHEGMPISLLEAMSYGLPVVCSNAGAIVDFFKNGKMGYMINSLEPKAYITKIQYLLSNPSLVKNISFYNQRYVKQHHLASTCAAEIDYSYHSILFGNLNKTVS